MNKFIVIITLFVLSCSGTNELTVESPEVDYDRGDWRHWIDADGDCQDTRQEVLIRQSEIPVEFNDDRECKVSSGKWTCPYTGETFTNPSDLDVDHVISLHEAHNTGGWAWDYEKRKLFANDLESKELIAVSASANRSKGSRGPTKWLPKTREMSCNYLIARVEVQTKWELSIPPEESDFVLRMIVKDCID